MKHDLLIYVVKHNRYQIEGAPLGICYDTTDFIEDYGTSAPIGNGEISRQIFANRENAEKAFRELARSLKPATSTTSGDTRTIEYEVVSLLVYSYNIAPDLLGATPQELVENYDENDQIIIDEEFSPAELIPDHLVSYLQEETDGVNAIHYRYTYRSGNRKHLQTIFTDKHISDHSEIIELYRRNREKTY